MSIASRLSLAATVSCAIACEAAAAAPRYRLTILDALQGEAVAINNAGEIAGNLWNEQGGGAVVGWFGGRKEVLPDTFASATAISSQGHIAGYSKTYSDGDGIFSSSGGLVYYRGTMAPVPEAFPAGGADAPRYSYTTPVGVNSAGQVIGYGMANSGRGPFLADGLSLAILPMARLTPSMTAARSPAGAIMRKAARKRCCMPMARSPAWASCRATRPAWRGT